MSGKRLTIIGGASPYMTSMLTAVANFVRTGDLAGSEVVLMDIDSANLDMVSAWASQAAKNEGLDLKFSHTTDLDESLKDAEFILSIIRPGGLDARYLDETIPLQYGEMGNETVGVGGIFMALRTIPAAVKISKAVQKQCPKAWLIDYTNPVHMITEATIRAGHPRTVGLCDGVFGVKWLTCKLLGMDTKHAVEVDALVAGINHCTWATKISFHGRDIYAELDELIEKADLTPVGYEDINQAEFNRIDVDAIRLYKYFGLLPGSTYYARDYYSSRSYIGKLKEPGHEQRSQWLKRIAAGKREKIKKELDAGTAAFEPFDEEDAAHGDQAISVINAIANDSRLIEAVNVTNNGAVPFLPEDAVVEAGAMITASGPQPIAAGNLPLAVQPIVKGVHDFGRLTVDAAFTHDRRKVLQAAMAHPLHREIDIIEKVIDELFKAHAKWLPDWS